MGGWNPSIRPPCTLDAMRVRHHLEDLSLGRRVALRALTAFLITFAVLRALTAIIHFNLLPHGPFHDVVTASGLHVHHLFWGILLLMVSGFVALATRDAAFALADRRRVRDRARVHAR